ncbi:MAG: FtsX-like permease family protein, partial [Acidimicrobiales bacterium]
AMGSVAGARRTQSSYPVYLTGTNPSDLDVGFVSQSTASSGVASLKNQLARLPDVKHVANDVELLIGPVRSNGTLDSSNAFVTGSTQAIGSANGLFFKQDRVTVIKGRMANPARDTEFVTDSETARLTGWHLNETIPFGAITLAQAATGASTIKAHFRFDAKLVGIVVFNNHAVVHDDVDHFVSYALFTPALTRSLIASAGFWPFVVYGLQLDHGSHDLAAVEQEIIGLIPRGAQYNFYVPAVVEAEVQRAIKPETIALEVFGAIAALATLLIASQAIGRQLRANEDDLHVLRAIGATPTMVMTDGLIGVLAAVFLGAFLAASVAVGLSPLAPIGAVREVDPSPGIAFDWDVLGAGFGVLIIGLGVFALALAYWRSPDRITRQGRRIEGSGSRIVRAAMSSGLAAPAIVGLGFAFDPGRGRTAAPVRSALFGTALAVLMVVATLTFGSGLQTLVSHPALYGWNWSYALEQTTGGNVPPQVRALLSRSPDVAAWTGFNFASAQIDGQTVPILAGSAHAELTPPILTGHALEANDQIVLGSATLAQLHKRVGDRVVVSYGSPKDAPFYVPPTSLVIVGTATMPAIGGSGTLHPSMGTGALVANGIQPVAMRRATASPYPTLNGPTMVVVRLRDGVSPATGLASLQRMADAGTKALAALPAGQGGGTVVVLPVQHPAEIVNYRSVGATPTILVSGLAVGAIVALGLTLIASVRRRRRDLALLKTLGFTRRQLAATVAWQASVVAVIGTIVGAPVGVVLGRWLWIRFAREIYAVPDPTVPVMSIVYVALGAFVLANLVAFFPGRVAGRTQTALMLRTE